MTNDDMIATFKTKLEKRLGLYDAQSAERAPIQKEFVALLQVEWRKVSRNDFSFAQATEIVSNYKELRAPFEARAEAIKTKQAQDRTAMDEELQKLADSIVITDAMKLVDKSQWSRYDERSTSDYHTQGFGAVKYAQSAAEDILDHVKANGVGAEIRRIDRGPTRSCGYSMDSVSFPIYAACDATTCEIIRRKPGISLREYVRRSWARGANPRVSMPMLPPDYEAKNGLDYFGGEIKQEARA